MPESTVSVPIESLERAELALGCRVKLLDQSIAEATGRRNLGVAQFLREAKGNDFKALETIRAIIKEYRSI